MFRSQCTHVYQIIICHTLRRFYNFAIGIIYLRITIFIQTSPTIGPEIAHIIAFQHSSATTPTRIKGGRHFIRRRDYLIRVIRISQIHSVIEIIFLHDNPSQRQI